MLTQHWFNRASHLHLLSHSFSTTLLVVMCWQRYLSKVIVTLSHIGFSCHVSVGFIGLKLLLTCCWGRHYMVINDICEGERQWKFQKNQYLLNTHLSLTLLSKQFPRQPPWSIKVSDNDNCDTAVTAPGPLTGTGTRPIGDAYELTSVLALISFSDFFQ